MWLIILWLAFPMTLTRSLHGLLSNQMLWVVVFAIFGPLAYLGGQHFGRLELSDFAIVGMIMQWVFMGVFTAYLLGDHLEYSEQTKPSAQANKV